MFNINLIFSKGTALFSYLKVIQEFPTLHMLQLNLIELKTSNLNILKFTIEIIYFQ